MSECRNLLKLKFKRKDFKYVLSRLFNKETGELDLDNFYRVPDTLRVPVSKDLVKLANGSNYIRLVEFAALDYLLSLEPSQFEEYKQTFLMYRFGQFADVREPLVLITNLMYDKSISEMIRDMNIDSYEEAFKTFFADHAEELANHGIFSLRDYGRVAVENLDRYNCVEKEPWLAKNCGIGSKEFSDNFYSYGNPEIKVVSNGKDTLYFDVSDVKSRDFVAMLDIFLFEAKDIDINVEDFDTETRELSYYNECARDRRVNLGYDPLMKKIDFINEFNEAFGEERYSAGYFFDEETTTEIGDDSAEKPAVYVKKD